MFEIDLQLVQIGTIISPIQRPGDAPRQGNEGGAEAWIDIDPAFRDAVDGLAVGDEILIFTWLHQADRTVLAVHPRGDLANPLTGIFATRSPHRPNPIGLHPVRILDIDSRRGIKVGPLEAIDGTPVIDIKPVI